VYFCQSIEITSLTKGLFIKKSGENRLADALATFAAGEKGAKTCPKGNYKLKNQFMKTINVFHFTFFFAKAGVVLSFIQHRFSFLCSSQNGSACSMRGQRSW